MSSSRRARSRRLKQLAANVIIVILGLIALLLLIGLFLPRTYRVERSIEIRGKAEVVYPELATLRRWPEWTAWNAQKDPGVRFTFESPETGAGAAYSWSGPVLGQGRLVLTRAESERGVWYDLDFEQGRYVSTGSITFEPAGDSLRVTWTHEGDLGRSPIGRYVGLFIDRMMGPDFESGLARLKARVESAGG